MGIWQHCILRSSPNASRTFYATQNESIVSDVQHNLQEVCKIA